MIKTQTKIVVRFTVEAIHNWPDAAKFEPTMAFLAFPHRHIFHFEAKKSVAHDDRDVEIIVFKRELMDYFNRNYFDLSLNLCNFGSKSCEMLANDLVEAYDLDEASCLEDNENGATVTKL